MIDRVWVVDEGEYSNYHVVAIFTDEDQARRFSALRPESDVHEWKVNAWSEDQCIYHVIFDRVGHGRIMSTCAWVESPEVARLDGVKAEMSRSGDIEIIVDRGPEVRAVKIASEYYAKIKAHMDEATVRVSQVKDRQTLSIEPYATIEENGFILDVAQVLAGIKAIPVHGHLHHNRVVRQALAGAAVAA